MFIMFDSMICLKMRQVAMARRCDNDSRADILTVGGANYVDDDSHAEHAGRDDMLVVGVSNSPTHPLTHSPTHPLR